MTWRGRALMHFCAAALSLLLAGFVLFATAVTRRAPSEPPRADGIVVLTGGSEGRIEAGLRLLRGHFGQRLLISGVNRRNRLADLLTPAALGQLTCCIDLGYDALDTAGNAAEARDWAVAHRYRRLIVVTSSYHMPRSIAELRQAMPDIELIAHAVVPHALREGPWWLRPAAIRMLGAEYLKLVPAYTRYLVHRVARGAEGAAARQAESDRRAALSVPEVAEPAGPIPHRASAQEGFRGVIVQLGLSTALDRNLGDLRATPLADPARHLPDSPLR